MTAQETAALVAELRAAYREALVAQEARDNYDRLARDTATATRNAWNKVYHLQQRLMEG